MSVFNYTKMNYVDKISEIVASAATKTGWRCLQEPPIPTRAGLRQPDLLFHHPDRDYFLIDVTIVADNADLVAAHQHKTVYYNTDDIRHLVSTNVSTKPLHISSVTLNWRGLLCAASAATLCNDLKLKKPVLSLLSAVTLERTVDISTF